MGILKRLRGNNAATSASSSSNTKRSGKRKSRRKSLFSFISPSDVTEASLQVWAGLPKTIRQDPSLASFQLEHDRLHGGSGDHDDQQHEEIALAGEDTESVDQSEFITMKMTNEEGHTEKEEEISAHPQTHVETHPNPHGHSHGHGSNHTTQLHPNIYHFHHNDHNGDEETYRKYFKSGFLLLCWLIFAAILMLKKEKMLKMKNLSVPFDYDKSYLLTPMPTGHRFTLQLDGVFLPQPFSNLTKEYMSISIGLYGLDHRSDHLNGSIKLIETVGDEWKIPIESPDRFDTAPINSKRHTYDFGFASEHVNLADPATHLRVRLRTNVKTVFSVKVGYDPAPMNMEVGVVYAALIIIMLYVLIIWEIVHRTFAAVVVSTMSIAILAALDDRPTMNEMMEWIDVETLLLLFSMMILVAVMTETGIFDYLAVLTFKVTGGKIWPLIHGLCMITLFVSSFLDNVTTILLMTPISIRLCEVVELNPVPVLMAIIVHANIGGTLTPVGDPPNVIITSNQYIAKHGVTFLTFTLHMAVGVVIVAVQTMLQLRFKYKNVNDLRLKEPTEIKELRREITVWKRAAASLSSYSKDADVVRETLLKKVKILQHNLKKKSTVAVVETERYKATLEELQTAYPIKNKALLIKSGGVLIFIIGLFFIQSIPEYQRLSIAWSALLGTILLLIIAGKDDMDALMSRIEWTTLLFFAAMFIIMESLARLGLIHWIGKQTENIIMTVSEESRLAVAIIIILWVSAVASAFVDSIPVTTMMLRVVISLADSSLGLPLTPLVWALAFGPCLGGNGTLVGASANIVCAGIAEQHGYKISFIEYFKFGFPLMLGSVIVTTGYLMVSHVLFSWH